MRAFEIQTFRNGKWRIDSMFDDREIALYEAERMDGSGRFSGIRVVEEVYDEETQETRTRTIYRGNRVQQEQQDRLEESRRTGQQRKERDAVREGMRMARQRPAKAKSRGFYGPLLLFTMLGLLGLALLIGLRYAQELM